MATPAPVDDGTRALLPLLLKAEEGHIDELVRQSLARLRCRFLRAVRGGG